MQYLNPIVYGFGFIRFHLRRDSIFSCTVKADLHQAKQAKKVVNCHRQQKHHLQWQQAPHPQLAHAACCFGPTETMIDQLSLPLRNLEHIRLRDRIRYPRLAVEGVLQHMNPQLQRNARNDEVFDVKSLIRMERYFAVVVKVCFTIIVDHRFERFALDVTVCLSYQGADNQPVAVVANSLVHIAKVAGGVVLTVQLGITFGHRLVGFVDSPLVHEVLGRETPVLVLTFVFSPEVLVLGPNLNVSVEDPIEVKAQEKCAHIHDRHQILEEQVDRIELEQGLFVFADQRRRKCGAVYWHCGKPAKDQVLVLLCQPLQLRTNALEVLQHHHPKQLLQQNTFLYTHVLGCIHHDEHRPQFHQRRVGGLPNFAMRVAHRSTASQSAHSKQSIGKGVDILYGCHLGQVDQINFPSTASRARSAKPSFAWWS